MCEVRSLVDTNIQLGQRLDQYDCQGHSLGSLSRQARAELLCEAHAYTATYRDALPEPPNPASWILLAGHQPQLFHPGVWLKNFALGHLANQHGAVAVNLTIDSDTCRNTLLRVPGGTVSEPEALSIPFDGSGPRVPHEQRQIQDRQLMAAFGEKASRQMASLVADPSMAQYWPLVRQRMEVTDNLGTCLAQARHQLEGQWGLATLEIPQSRVCQTEAFFRFVAHLLAQADRFREVYNAAVREYRMACRIRSKAHPVPDLAIKDAWTEVPFWVYSDTQPQRRRLFLRRQGQGVLLGDLHGWQVDLPLNADGDSGRAVQRLSELAETGVKIRSRALVTTLWARLALSDLFLHGIGGAKYDQVTDLIIHRFFGLTPPRFMILSATLHLPTGRRPISPQSAGTLKHQLRALTYHPECYLNGGETAIKGAAENPAELIAEKTKWTRTPQTPQNARTRCKTIRRINRALQPWVEPRRIELQQEQAQLARTLRADEILAWREYGFCLYPEKTLRDFLSGLLPKNA